MNKDTLIQLFKAPYKRQAFIDNALLPTFQGKVANLKILDAQGVQEIELTASEQNYAVSAVKYGEFQTLDEIPRTVELFEVIVNDNKQIERSRVGLGALIKKHIIGNNAVLVNFAYQKPEKRSWRFSFIARDGLFQDGEMQITDTHPKRYTYVFGEPDETYKTALDRFFVLGNELEITINKIKDAFGVEAMSKAFFDEYCDVHYAGFVDYLMRSNFKKSAFNGNDKDVRDFVKKLLGRIVFLYFLQKKGWLGAKDTSYKNGDKNFMTNFFKKAGANDAFYANWLSKLFFDALNNNRPNDDFTMPNGEVVKIPYLNGGLFEKESAKYDFLTFPSDLFTNLFEFFDQYNFTIFEDSPEEHTIAVDPEMLGHIFENLLEDNKDKGTFYTPKEIVHYMTQESLIEYLHTQIPDANRNDLENFVKNKENKLSKENKQQIDQKLDTVKICDPAIGSGAFPMGLLQEIFGLKERIAYDLGYKDWSPATVKENIIQKSIYGVDIERGAVDIARLRFWLSLIVDEVMPKALPNLDYKIVVGNSLVSKFDDTVIEIDWERKGSVGEANKHVQGVQTALNSISQKQKQFFESKSNHQKAKLKAEIRDLKLDVLINQLSFNKAAYLNKKQKIADLGFGLKATDHKKNVEIDLQVAEFNQALSKLKNLKNNPDQDFNHFDWKLDFPEVLNPVIADKNGFDIVIGNPPYVRQERLGQELKEILKKRFPSVANGTADLYVYFFSVGLELLTKKGVLSYITLNKYLKTKYGLELRNLLASEYDVNLIIDFFELPVFEASTDASITTIVNSKENLETKYFPVKTLTNLNLFELTSGPYLKVVKDATEWKFIDHSQESILDKLYQNSISLKEFSDDKIYRGITTGLNEAFILDSEISQKLLKSESKKIVKPYAQSTDIKKWGLLDDNRFFLATGYDIDVKKEYPTAFNYLSQFEKALKNRQDKGRNWWNLRACKYYGDFAKPKIIYMHTAKKHEFYLDTKGCYINNSCYMIVSDSRYLFAFLNSKLFEWFKKIKFVAYGDAAESGRAKLDYNKMITVPIKNTNKKQQNMFDKLVNQILSLKEKGKDTAALEHQIDNLVYKLYELTYDEVKVIDPEFPLSKKEYDEIVLE
jgi:adenine-specific DNA-methyltransferase